MAVYNRVAVGLRCALVSTYARALCHLSKINNEAGLCTETGFRLYAERVDRGRQSERGTTSYIVLG